MKDFVFGLVRPWIDSLARQRIEDLERQVADLEDLLAEEVDRHLDDTCRRDRALHELELAQRKLRLAVGAMEVLLRRYGMRDRDLFEYLEDGNGDAE